MRIELRSYLLAVSALLAACGGGSERTIIEPPPPPNTDFVFTFSSHGEDMSVAQQLGWTSGIPGAEVTVTPTEGPVRTFTTSATGTVAIAGLQAGDYRISVRRLFTTAEIAKVAASGAMAYVGETELNVASSSGAATIQVPANYRRSLVISEWSFTGRYIPGSGYYAYGGFLELYNNSDTTIYLDGVLIVEGLAARSFETAIVPCATIAPYTNDPAGAWTEWMAAFPGGGREFPLAPGRNVVIATDAIDHSVIFPGMIDLRGADFEFIGALDVDNPAAPNMVDRSLRDRFFGHGLSFSNSLATVAAVALPADVSTFNKEKLPPNGTEYVRVPRALMLDTYTTISTYYANKQPPLIACPQLLNAAMDRKYGIFLGDTPDDYLISASRKVLTTLPDGRLVLQHTRTSANDFKRTPRTPGVVAP